MTFVLPTQLRTLLVRLRPGVNPPAMDGDDPAPANVANDLKRLALTNLPEALELADALRDCGAFSGRTLAPILAAQAHVLCYANRFDDALSVLAEAMKLCEEVDATTELADVCLASIQPLARTGRFEQAENAARRALSAYRRTGQAQGAGRALLNLGNVLRMQDRAGAAIDAFNEARPLVASDAFLVGALMSNRAEALLDLDRFREARDSFEAASDAFTLAQQHHAAAIVEGNIADLLSRQGHVDEALDRFDRARRKFEDAGAPADAARILAEEAEALAFSGAGEAAAQSYARSLPVLESSNLRKETARALLGLALLLLKTSAAPHSVSLLTQARDLLAQLGNRVLAAECDIILSASQLRRTASLESLDQIDRSLLELADRPARLAHALAEVTGALLDTGHAATAQRYVRELESASEAAGLAPLRAKAWHAQGKLNQAAGNRASAAQMLGQAVELAERDRDSIHAEQLRLCHGESWRQVYLDAIRCALDEGSPTQMERAFEYLERMRARSLFDAGSSRLVAHEQTCTSRPSRELEEYKEELSVLYSRVWRATSAEGAPESREHFRRIADLESRLQRLRMSSSSVDSSRLLRSGPMSADEVRSSLRQGQVIVEYFADGPAVSAFVIKPGGVSVHRGLCALQDVDESVRRLRFCVEGLLADGTDGAHAQPRVPMALWRALLTRLGNLLIEPLQAALGQSQSAGFCGFGSLTEVPWGLLIVHGRMLLEQLTITTVPSASAAMLLHTHAVDQSPPAATAVIGVADEFAMNIETELAAIMDAVPSATRLSGSEATFARTTELMSRADVLHLSLHCVYSPRHPALSRVHLADGWFTARDLAPHVRPGARVILAGCETGRGGGPSTEDRTGLASVLLSAGATHVLGTHWPLHDHTATSLFPRLHLNVARSDRGALDLAEALRRTQCSLLQDGVPSWYWGACYIIGGLS